MAMSAALEACLPSLPMRPEEGGMGGKLMDEWVCERLVGEWMGKWLDAWLDEWLDEWLGKWLGAWLGK